MLFRSKLRMAARGSVIKVIGDETETAEFEKKVKELESYCAKFNKLTEDVILDIIKGEAPRDAHSDDVIITGSASIPVDFPRPGSIMSLSHHSSWPGLGLRPFFLSVVSDAAVFFPLGFSVGSLFIVHGF